MSHPIDLIKDNFDQEVLKSSVPVLVDFWAPWCGPCRMMAPVLEELMAKVEGKIKVAKLNVDETENQALAEQYQIQSIPAMKIFKDGVIVKEFVGFQPIDELYKNLGEFLN